MEDLTVWLDRVPGTVSVWVGTPGGRPFFARSPDHEHYAASMMKVPLLVALYGSGIPLDTTVPVHDDFESACPGSRYRCERRHDQDDDVWAQLGGTATLGWLAERMITRSSNLASNLVLEQAGFAEIAAAWSRAGARRSVVRRGIADQPAANSGITNVVTARDISALLGSIEVDLSPVGSAMIDIMTRQQRTEDLGAGLPPGTRAAYKNGWVMGVRHAAGVIYPPDTRPFVLAVCCTTPVAKNKLGDESCRIVTETTRWAWSQRHSITAAG